MQWIFENKEVTDEMTKPFVGFVYIIENLVSGRKYIGQKLFRSMRKKSVKGIFKKVLTESDWRKYYGSSLALQSDVEMLGKDNFKREIIRFCQSKSEMNYHELREQIVTDCLLKPNQYYNNFCGTKIHGKHLKNLYMDKKE